MASIFIMRATSAFKVINYACKNREKWRTGLIFDTTNRISATYGGLLGEKIPPGGVNNHCLPHNDPQLPKAL